MYILVGVIVVIAVGIIAMPKKKNVSKKLDRAKELLVKGEVVKVNEMLDEIIIFPIGEKYSEEYAIQLVESLKFLKEVCRAQNLLKDDLIDPVIGALNGIQAEGGKIDSSVVEPLEQWIEQMSKDTASQVNQMMADAMNGNIEMVESEREVDFSSEVTEQSEIDVLNKMGSFLLKRKFAEGIKFVEEHMPEQMSPFKASLLDQKAGLLFMDGKVDKAVSCYQEILKYYPESYRIKSALAEGYVALKDYEKALIQAKEVLNFSRDKDSVKTCKQIVSKYGK